MLSPLQHSLGPLGVKRGGGIGIGKTGLVSWWSLDEASGTRNDSHGTNHLTDNNTVGSTTGVKGNAAQFVAANSESLSVASNASLETGNVDFWLGGWIRFTSIGDYRFLINKDNNGAAREWSLYYANDNPKTFSFYVVRGGVVEIRAASLIPTTSTWYLVQAWHDNSDNSIYIRVNDGTIHTTSLGGTPSATAAALELGKRSSALFHNGLMDEVFYFKNRVPTTDDLDFMYNGGSGRTYSEL